MFITINGGREIEIKEDFLIIKDNKLYNTRTKKREGLDGDIVSFVIDNGSHKTICRGTVDGYTCGNRIKIRGYQETFHDMTDIKFEHISVITKSNFLNIEDEETAIAEGN